MNNYEYGKILVRSISSVLIHLITFNHRFRHTEIKVQ